MNGKLDAIVIDSYTALKLTEGQDSLALIDDEAFEAEEYAIAVKKGNTELLNELNKYLNELKDSGKIADFSAQYQ